MKKLAVIILNWNGEKLLRQFIPAASESTCGEEADLIVADNGSTDGSVAWLKENHPEVKCLELGKNYGFAEGYNRAIEAFRDYPYTLLLNSDVAVGEGWWQPLLRFIEENPAVGACQPKIRSHRNPEYFEYAGAAGGLLDRLAYPYCRGRLFDRIEKDEGQYDSGPADIAWASGAALMVDTALYRRLGGLDPRFFAHMEEIDLCWRIRLAGYTIAAVPAATAYHLGGGSLPAENPRKTYLNFRNNLLMLHKNLPDAVRGRRLNIRRLLDTVAWAKYVASFDFANASAIWRAHRDFAKMRRKYTVHPDRNLLVESPESRVNILTQYYLRGRRTFGGLGIG